MALLDLPYPAHVEQRAPYGSGFPGSTNDSNSVQFLQPPPQANSASAVAEPFGRNSNLGDMQTSLSGSASSGSLAPPPGLPQSSSTAELVALGLLGSNSHDDAAGLENTEYNSSSDGGGYDPRPPIPTSNSSGNMVGLAGGAGLDEMRGSGGGRGYSGGGGGGDIGGGNGGLVNAVGTGSAGGMGLGLRRNSLTNLANMVRSQSVSSFHSEFFPGGAAARMTSGDPPAWGSYPANLDKAGGGGSEVEAGNIFVMSPATGPMRGQSGAGGLSRGTAGLRPPSSGGGGGGVGDVGGSELSPQQYAGRGTAPRREVERGVPSWATAMRTSQRRPMAGSSVEQRGGVPSGPGGGAPTSGRAMVHNRSDTDLVASFSRLGFGGQSGVSRWSPLMSPTASPLVGAPLLEEDPLDLELEGSAHGMGGGADTFGGASYSLRSSHRQRSLANSSDDSLAVNGMSVRMARHASYPSLKISRSNGIAGNGVEDLVHGALEHLTVGDSATGIPGVDINGGSSSGGLGPSGLSSGSLSGGNAGGGRVGGRVNPGSGSAGLTGSKSGAMPPPGSRGGGGYTTGQNSSALSPADSVQRPPQGMRQGGQVLRHRSHPDGGNAGPGHDHRPNQQSYDQQGRGSAGMGGGVDGVMMSDGRFVPSTPLMADGGLGGHPGLMYGEGGGAGYSGGGGGAGGGGYDGMGGGRGMTEAPWGATAGASQDPVTLYQALLMKQSLDAAHASGMRFPNPNMMPVSNGMGVNMLDMAAFAAAAQAAATSGRGGYGGGVGGYPGMDGGMQSGYGRRDGGGQQRMGPRGGVDVGSYSMSPMGGGGVMRMNMGRGNSGMYEVEDVGDGNVYHVQFKRSTRNFLLGKTCQRDLQVLPIYILSKYRCRDYRLLFLRIGDLICVTIGVAGDTKWYRISIDVVSTPPPLLSPLPSFSPMPMCTFVFLDRNALCPIRTY